MNKEMDQKLSSNILSLVNNFYRRTPSDYMSISKGIEMMKSLSMSAMFFIVMGMGLMVRYEYHVVTLILAVFFYLAYKFFKNSSLLYVVKTIYEQETALVKFNSQDDNDDDLERNTRQIIRKYLKDKRQETKELLDKVS